VQQAVIKLQRAEHAYERGLRRSQSFFAGLVWRTADDSDNSTEGSDSDDDSLYDEEDDGGMARRLEENHAEVPDQLMFQLLL